MANSALCVQHSLPAIIALVREPANTPSLEPARRSLHVLRESTSVAGRPWYSRGLKFRCTGCGNCCTGPAGYVWISEEEVARLADHLGKSVADVRKGYVRAVGGRLSLRERKNLQGKYDCVFLTDLPPDPVTGAVRRGCGVYEARPLQCRTWPFWDGVVASRASWNSAKTVCEGMDQGRHYTQTRIEKLRDATEWPDSPPSSE